MQKSEEKNTKKVPKITEEQYEEYIMSLKDEPALKGSDRLVDGKSRPHLDGERKRWKT